LEVAETVSLAAEMKFNTKVAEVAENIKVAEVAENQSSRSG
jgi:hypothetical protein